MVAITRSNRAQPAKKIYYFLASCVLGGCLLLALAVSCNVQQTSLPAGVVQNLRTTGNEQMKPLVLAAHDEDEYRLARQQSFGFFQNAPEDSWTLMQNIMRDHIPHLYPDGPLTYNPEATDADQSKDRLLPKHRAHDHFPAWYQTVRTIVLYSRRQYLLVSAILAIVIRYATCVIASH